MRGKEREGDGGGGGWQCETEGQTERMRWDYRDNASRWREVEAPAGLATPNGLKDFSRATDKPSHRQLSGCRLQRTSDTNLSRAHPPPPAVKPGNENLPSFSMKQ